MRYLILYLGADWWGSDARALAVALRAQGHTMIELNYEDYLPTQWSSFILRALRRLLKPLFAANYNRAVRRNAANVPLDFVLVFKGMLLQAATLGTLRQRNIPCYCFYPDVSFADHGSNIRECLPLYDCIFTTKSFHVESDQLQRMGPVHAVSHGFDPEVHRPIELSESSLAFYGCDISFVGCWSSKKEAMIRAIIRTCPDVKVKVWGPGWERANPAVRQTWQGRGAYGDELAVVYNASKINLGLLSEAGSDTAEGDAVTARTWQIPASGGFLLHEETDELKQYFAFDEEVATFRGEGDLPEKIRYYLGSPQERSRIARAGHRRCVQDGYTYARAAEIICSYHQTSQSNRDQQSMSDRAQVHV